MAKETGVFSSKRTTAPKRGRPFFIQPTFVSPERVSADRRSPRRGRYERCELCVAKWLQGCGLGHIFTRGDDEARDPPCRGGAEARSSVQEHCQLYRRVSDTRRYSWHGNCPARGEPARYASRLGNAPEIEDRRVAEVADLARRDRKGPRGSRLYRLVSDTRR